MASTQTSKVYRLQGVPSNVGSSDEVIEILRKVRAELESYDIQVHSLAAGLTLLPIKVASIMFSLKPEDRRRYSQDLKPPTKPRVPSSVAAWATPFIDLVAQVKDDLVLDDDFFGMTPLNDIDLDDYEFNCIAISGIGSHAFGSWQPRGGDKQFMWIRDALPKLFPSTRFMLYGYNTELLNTHSFQRIQDIAITFVNHLRAITHAPGTRRRLVFIAHSLGGIVLKQALVDLALSHEPLDSKLFETISGAIFFGVPNYGMVVSQLVALAPGKPNNKLIEQLKEGSVYLSRLEGAFESLSRNGEKLSWKPFFWGYETKESIIPTQNPRDGSWSTKDPNAPRLKLVEPQSATRGLCERPELRLAFQINEDHSSMVKFASMHDPNLIIVVNILKQIFERPFHEGSGNIQSLNTPLGFPRNFDMLQGSASRSTSERGVTLQTTIELPSKQNQKFKLPSESENIPAAKPLFGRKAELQSLAKVLSREPTARQNVVLLHGPLGIGKTQVIAHYVKTYGRTYDNIFYINGTTSETFSSTLGREANRVRKSWLYLLFKAFSWPDTHCGNIERFCTFLNSDGNHEWLLMIDEVRESFPIMGIVERLKQGSIVLISSSSGFATKYPALRLGPLEPVPSVEMLLHHYPYLEITPEHYNLLSKLDYHPALIELAVPKMLAFKTRSIFLSNWQDGKIKLPSQTMAKIKDILEDEFPGGLPPYQKDILELCLPFDHKAISYEFLEFLGLPNLDLFFGDNMERFAKHGLVEMKILPDEKVTYSVSVILYQYLRQSVENWRALLERVANILAPKVPRSSKDDHRVSIELLAPHARLFAKYVIDARRSSPPPSTYYLDCIERIASLLRLLGNDGDAIKLYGFVHQQNKAAVPGGQESLSFGRTAELYNNMGLSWSNEGDIGFARACFKRAKAALEGGKLGDSETMLKVIVNIAQVHIDMEDYHSAEQLLENSVFKFENKGQDLLPLQHILGFTYLQLGQTDRGVQILEEACQAALKSRRAGKRLAYSIVHDLATAYRKQKRWSAAINLYQKAREGRKCIHGLGHRLTMETTAALAAAYHSADQRDKAAVCFQEALKWQREHLRPNHPDTLQTLENYGIFSYDIGQMETAKKALHLAHIGNTEHDKEIRKTTWKRINSGVSLALVLQRLKSFKESTSLFEEAVSWYESQNAVVNPEITYQHCKTLCLLGAMYKDWGFPYQAFKYFEQAGNVPDDVEGEVSYWKQLAMKKAPRTTKELGHATWVFAKRDPPL